MKRSLLPVLMLLLWSSNAWASFTLSAHDENGGGGSSTTVAVTVAGLDVNDLVVVCVGNGSAVDVSSVSDTGSAFTARALNTATTNNRLKCFYKLASDKTGSVTYTATFASAASGREIHVWAFAPSGTPVFDTDRTDGGNGGASDTTVATGSITTSGSDEVLVVACYHGSVTTVTSPLIIGAAASSTLDPGGNMSSWYNISTGTGGGTGTLASTSNHLENIIAFKMSGGGGFTAKNRRTLSPRAGTRSIR